MTIRVTGRPTCSLCYRFASTKSLCGSCKSIAYCSPKCQKLDWPLHKALCKEFALLGPRPSECHKLTFYFPVDSTSPELGWLQCPKNPQPQRSDEEIELLSRKDINSKGNTIKSSFIFFGRDCRDNDPKLNLSIISVAHGAYWNGPVVVFRKDRPGSSSIFLDVALADFRVVVKILGQLSLVENNSRPDEVVQQNTKLTQGVLFAPSGEESYDVASIPDNHPIYDMEPTSVTKQLGMPLIVQEIFQGVNSDDPFDDDSLRTRICTSLHIDVDPDSKTWGKTLPGWRRRMGHFLVVRQDKQDITYDQLSEVVGYIDALTIIMFMTTTRFSRKELVQNYLNQEQFELNKKATCPELLHSGAIRAR